MVAPDRTWQLIRLDGQPFAARATLRIGAQDAFDGQTPCNSYGGGWTGGGGAFAAGPIRATRRACPELAAEQSYLAALSRITAYDIADDLLTLSGPETTLVFTPAPPA